MLVERRDWAVEIEKVFRDVEVLVSVSHRWLACFIAHVQGAGPVTTMSAADQIEQPEVVHENG
jgi:hypothetical protein